MTKLEWCRMAAPAMFKNLPEDELLAKYGRFYDEMYKDVEYKSIEHKTLTVDKTVTFKSVYNIFDALVRKLQQTFGDIITFEDGYILSKILPDVGRQTVDIDLNIPSVEYSDAIYNLLKNACDKLMVNGIITKYILKPIEVGNASVLKLYDNEGQQFAGIDVCVKDDCGDKMTVDLNFIKVNSISIEQMLSNKISAVLSPKRMRRVKDIYDIYIITNNFDIDILKLRSLLSKVVDIDVNKFPFSKEDLEKYAYGYNRLNINSALRDAMLSKPEFNTVLERYYTILGGVCNVESYTKWDCSSRSLSR